VRKFMVSETYYRRYGFRILVTLYKRYYNFHQITLTKKQRFQTEINVESTLTCSLGSYPPNSRTLS